MFSDPMQGHEESHRVIHNPAACLVSVPLPSEKSRDRGMEPFVHFGAISEPGSELGLV